MEKDTKKLDLKSYHLPAEHIDSIERCIAEFTNFSKSIFLTGSWAQKVGNSSSDVDILVIIDNPSKMRSALNIAKKFRSMKRNRRFLDVRVITEDALQKLTKPKIRFYYWNQLETGVLVHGMEQRYRFGIDESSINVLVGHLQETLNHICVNLESNLMYTGSAVMLYDVTKTIYYIKHNFISDRVEESKKQFIRDTLKESYSIARKSYYDSLSNSSDELELKISTKTDSKYDSSDYMALLERTTEVSLLLESYKKTLLEINN